MAFKREKTLVFDESRAPTVDYFLLHRWRWYRIVKIQIFFIFSFEIRRERFENNLNFVRRVLRYDPTRRLVSATNLEYYAQIISFEKKIRS